MYLPYVADEEHLDTETEKGLLDPDSENIEDTPHTQTASEVDIREASRFAPSDLQQWDFTISRRGRLMSH